MYASHSNLFYDKSYGLTPQLVYSLY